MELRTDFGSRELRVDLTTFHVSEKKKVAEVFHQGSEIQVRFSTNWDAYIHLFGIDQVGNLVRLYPNLFAGGTPLRAGKELVYLSQNLGRRVRIRTSGTHGASASVESILVIATRSEIRLLSKLHVDHPTVSNLNAEFEAMDPQG